MQNSNSQTDINNLKPFLIKFSYTFKKSTYTKNNISINPAAYFYKFEVNIFHADFRISKIKD